jgi:PAS domain S-box-containing protein
LELFNKWNPKPLARTKIEASEYYWKMVSHVDRESLDTMFDKLISRLLYVNGLLALLFLVACAYIANAIVKRRKSEQSLKESEGLLRESGEFLQSSLDALSASIAVLDENGIIIYVNQAWRRFAEDNGLEAADYGIGSNYLKVSREARGNWSEEAGIVVREIERIMLGEIERFELEYPCHSPDENRWFLMMVTSFGSMGSRRIVVSHENITESKMAEERMREAKNAAEAANLAKSQFLSGMSHELRTPLNAIIGFSEVLQDGIFGELNEKQEEYIGDIRESGRHLMSLIDGILELTKLEAGKIVLRPRPVELGTFLRESVIMIKAKAERHGISLDIVIPEEVEQLRVNVDDSRLKQVMYNLLSNAAKFTPDGGSIRVDAALLGENIRVSVTDTGIGIPREHIDSVFEEFYQAQSGRTNKTPGTGLGLSLIKKIVEMHGGSVRAESEGQDRGSRFSFTLPATPA